MSVFKINKSPDEESDKTLRDKLNAHSVTPPSYIWDNVEENLPQERKRRGIIFWLLPLAACLFGLAGALYMVLPKNASDKSKVAYKQIITDSFNAKSTTNNDRKSVKKDAKSAINSSNETAIENKIISSDKLIVDQDYVSGFSKNTRKNNNFYLYARKNTKQLITSGNENLTGKFGEHSTAKLNSETVSKSNQNSITESNENTNIQSNKEIIKIIEADSTLAKENAKEKLAENILIHDKSNIGKKSKNAVNLSKWSLGISGGFGSSYRYISHTKSFEMTPADALQMDSPVTNSTSFYDYNQVESAGKSWNAGLNFRYALNEKWNVSSGLAYTNTNIRSSVNIIVTTTRSGAITNSLDSNVIQKNSTGEFTYGEADVQNLPQTRDLNTTEKTQSNYNVKYTFGFVDIPLHLQYKTSATKLAWFVNGGASFRFLVNKNATYTIGEKNTSTQLLQPYNPTTLSADISTGIVVPLKRFNFEIGPEFSYWLSPLMKTEPKTHLYNTQLKSAIYYRF